VPDVRTIGPGTGGIGTLTLQSVLRQTDAFNQNDNVLPEMVNANSYMVNTTLNLAAGANTVTVQANSGGVVLIPPSTNTYTIALSTDLLYLSPTGVTMIPFDKNHMPTTLLLTAGGAINNIVVHWM
jgi:hypothetical protein